MTDARSSIRGPVNGDKTATATNAALPTATDTALCFSYHSPTMMSSSDEIRIDASTVHRPAENSGQSNDLGSANTSSPPPVIDPSQMAEAKTVIRGSSHESQRRVLSGTPATVTQGLLGQHLDHFLLEELIGGGGMGAVFRAHDEQLDRTVAIKVIPFVGKDGDLKRRFQNEAKSAAKLDHPRIARVFGVGDYDDWHYIVFEYIRGTNIRDLVTEAGVLHIDDAVFYTCELAEAIQHAADRGIVHRDIKPSNVLIGDDDNIKLVDMGLARSDNLELSEDKTASGVTLGTFDYISPEQAHDPRDADFRSDIYSLGCTFYFMVTGRPPYPGGTILQKLMNHGSAPPPNPRELRSDVSNDLAAIIQKMLAKNPDDRYQSAATLVADLREIARRERLPRSQAIGAVLVAQPNPVAMWVERHAPWMVAAFLLLISAAWMHLTTVTLRDDVSLTPPASALPPARITPVVVEQPKTELIDESQQSDDVEIKSDGVGEQEMSSESSGESVSPATPAESGIDAGPNAKNDDPKRSVIVAATTQESGETSVDVLPDVGISVNDDPNGIDPLLTAAAIHPNLIRVLGRREGMDLLSDHRERYEDGVLLSKSFAEALELAAQYQVKRIEIAAPVVASPATKVSRDGLLITSAIPGGSVIVFESSEVASMDRQRMLDVGSNRIELTDLHFVWNVPPGLEDGGSLIGLNDNRLVRMTDCSITINNRAGVDEIYAFDVITDPEAIDWSRRDQAFRDDDALPLVAIEMENVIVRGQMTMVHMDYATELQLQWDNGLAAISGRMIDTAGARTRPPLTSAIRMSFTDLTAWNPEGLIRMRLGVSGRYPLAIDRDARDSVFVVDAGAPFAEITGLDSLDGDTALLKIRGEGNTYDVNADMLDPMLALVDRNERIRETLMTELLTSAPSWFTEKSPRWSVWWSSVRRDDVAPDQFQPSNFYQDGTGYGGFDEKSLPGLPDTLAPADDIDTPENALKAGKIPLTSEEL